MTYNRERRDFFKDLILEMVNDFLDEMSAGSRESSREAHNYFDSFESCYPLISEAGDMLSEEAEKKGITTEGKSKHDIARELFSEREA